MALSGRGIVSGAVWIDGSFIERDDARIGAFDAGFQHGVGLFETMLAREGVVGDLAQHLDRLRDSARALRLSENLRVPALAEAVETAVIKADLPLARVRLTITGGDLNMLAAGAGPTDPTILIDVRPATSYPEPMYENGVTVVIAERRENPLDTFTAHKTLNYWPRLAELQRASTMNAAEAVSLQVSNHLAGGCVSNLFVVRDGVLLTPIARGEEDPGALPSPVLPGITRRRVIEHAEETNITLQTRLLSINDLLDSDEAFLTNSSWGVLPVVRVEGSQIGTGVPGEVSRSMLEHWRQAPAG